MIPFAAASQYQGMRDDGQQWSAVVNETSIAYQEDGSSFVAEGEESTFGGTFIIEKISMVYLLYIFTMKMIMIGNI